MLTVVLLLLVLFRKFTCMYYLVYLKGSTSFLCVSVSLYSLPLFVAREASVPTVTRHSTLVTNEARAVSRD
jgi:hypothetical protein